MKITFTVTLSPEALAEAREEIAKLGGLEAAKAKLLETIKEEKSDDVLELDIVIEAPELEGGVS